MDEVKWKDHPRSRGVYVFLEIPGKGHFGSSPLARGLRVGRGDHVVQSRIIPARAGFTGAGPPCRPPPMDHPRSRGVYTFQQAEITGYEGSSPLARGLQQGSLGLGERPWIIPARAGFTQLWRFRRRRHRIIPARAGFTLPRYLSRTATEDHPRSRGVYAKEIANTRFGKGSSPLARGLLVADSVGGCTKRIIPARAGFTCNRDPQSTHKRDHPRSRGVYLTLCERILDGEGSSPLARGLLAGLKMSFILFPDHPRSRGVYLWPACAPFFDGGSSPLARGLHRTAILINHALGIIPARAGFTVFSAVKNILAMDHPRSRGVYADLALSFASAVGSSPLARGLRTAVGSSPRARGIIPARAGFTTNRFRGRVQWPDHPRSRGVYWLEENYWNIEYWIIPARAGFTTCGRPTATTWQDHPRSRGVYSLSG